MTQRIYYSEPYRRSFDGKILAVDTVAGHTHVTLDQTAFYPTSGGQPFDTGTLGGAAVTDVIDREDGTIAHVVSGSPRIGEVLTGEIDWARRFDHMQQHTGQHVLSAAFDRLCGARTESFHMGQFHPTTQTTRGGGPGSTPPRKLRVAGAPGCRRRSIWRVRCPNPKSPGSKTTQTGSCGRIGRSRSGLRAPKKRRRCRFAKNRREPDRSV